MLYYATFIYHYMVNYFSHRFSHRFSQSIRSSFNVCTANLIELHMTFVQKSIHTFTLKVVLNILLFSEHSHDRYRCCKVR